MMVNGNIRAISCAIQLPCIISLVMQQLWMIVSFVEVFEDSREDLRLLVGQIDSSRVGLEELALAGSLEVR